MYISIYIYIYICIYIYIYIYTGTNHDFGVFWGNQLAHRGHLIIYSIIIVIVRQTRELANETNAYFNVEHTTHEIITNLNKGGTLGFRDDNGLT